MKTIVWFLTSKGTLPLLLASVVLSGFLSGCYRYYYNVKYDDGLTEESLQTYDTEGKNFILRDGLDAYRMDIPEISDNHLICTLFLLPYHHYTFLNNGMKGPGVIKSTEQKHILNEVHVFVKKPLKTSGLVKIPLNEIEKVEIFVPDKESNLSSGTITALAIGGAVVAAIIITVASNKKEPEPEPVYSGSSCPFIFSYDGTRYNFTGEIYGGAILPPLERHDYLHLANLEPSNNNYHVLFSNLAHEIQYTNLAELVVIDHDPSVKAIIGKNGNIYTLATPEPPLAAKTPDNPDLLDLISEEDNRTYISLPQNASDEVMSEIELTFKIPENHNHGKLVINARNSWFLDYFYREYLGLFGPKLAAWQNRFSKKSAENMMEWSREQGIPLAVYRKKDGNWKYEGQFETPGPMAFRKDILPLDLSDTGEDYVTLKLVAGKLFWEIDQIGMDFSENSIIRSYTLKPFEAQGNRSDNVLAPLLADDNDYFIQEETGDEAVLSFTVPEQAPQTGRSVFLHGKGHYKILADSENARSVFYLARFKKPESFTRFSGGRYLELTKAIGN